MTAFTYTRYGIRYAQVWFNEDAVIPSGAAANADIIEFKESYVALEGLYAFENGVVDLMPHLENILESTDKGFRYEVRRAEKEGITASEIPASSIEALYAGYAAFSAKKKSPLFPLDFLKRYADACNLFVSSASLKGAVLQYHIYFKDTREWILLASFPGEEGPSKAMTGFANRFLHWHDITASRAAGCTRCNLGGIGNSSAPGPKGIADFKREITKTAVPYFQGSIPLTLRGRFYSKLRGMLKR